MIRFSDQLRYGRGGEGRLYGSPDQCAMLTVEGRDPGIDHDPFEWDIAGLVRFFHIQRMGRALRSAPPPLIITDYSDSRKSSTSD